MATAVNVNYTQEELITLAQNGDSEALAVLCQTYTPLVEASARRYLGWKTAWDDLMQIGYEQLIIGILTFDDSRGVYLSHFLKRKVQSGIWTAVRSGERVRGRQATGYTLGDDEEHPLTIEGLADELAQGELTAVEWQELLAPLSPREKLAIEYTVLLDYKDRELAAVYGVSKDTVKTWRKRGLAKLKKAYAALLR